MSPRQPELQLHHDLKLVQLVQLQLFELYLDPLAHQDNDVDWHDRPHEHQRLLTRHLLERVALAQSALAARRRGPVLPLLRAVARP
jgi:hypothetical protein